MYELLYKYLALYKKLALPGIGIFTVANENAKINFTEKLLHPSVPYISFSLQTQPADKNFFQFLSREMHTDEVQAVQKFNDFLFSFKNNLSSAGKVLLPGIGTLTKQFINTYSFSPETQLRSYLPDIRAERVIRKNAQHSVKVGEDEKSSVEMKELLSHQIKKDRWRVYAIILAVAAISVILCYHLTH